MNTLSSGTDVHSHPLPVWKLLGRSLLILFGLALGALIGAVIALFTGLIVFDVC
jgi:hypothetical protein